MSDETISDRETILCNQVACVNIATMPHYNPVRCTECWNEAMVRMDTINGEASLQKFAKRTTSGNPNAKRYSAG